MNTVAVVCGGKGRRQDGQVKSLLPVEGRALIDWKLDELVAHGADQLCLLVAYGADNIREHVDRHDPGVPVTFVYDEGLGPWIAVDWALRGGYLPDEFFVAMGDVLVDVDLAHEGELPWMVVTTDSPDEPYNTAIVDGWCVQQPFEWLEFTHLDCGLYRTSREWFLASRATWRPCPSFQPRVVDVRTWQANTPESLGVLRGHLA